VFDTAGLDHNFCRVVGVFLIYLVVVVEHSIRTQVSF
jgi:hypothetical protein